MAQRCCLPADAAPASQVISDSRVTTSIRLIQRRSAINIARIDRRAATKQQLDYIPPVSEGC